MAVPGNRWRKHRMGFNMITRFLLCLCFLSLPAFSQNALRPASAWAGTNLLTNTNLESGAVGQVIGYDSNGALVALDLSTNTTAATEFVTTNILDETTSPPIAKALALPQYVSTLSDLATTSTTTGPSNVIVLDPLTGGEFRAIAGGTYPNTTGIYITNTASGNQWARADVLAGKPINPVWLGADPTGVADSAAPINSALSIVGITVGVPAISLEFPPGTFKLETPIRIRRRNVRMIGAGIGNPSTYTTPGRGTTLVWAGAGGEVATNKVMLEVRDVSSLLIDGFHFAGSQSDRPAAGILFNGVSGDDNGSNEKMRVQNCLFGHFAWPAGAEWSMTNGVWVTGYDANNDQFYFENCHFMRPRYAGVVIDSSQSVWGSFNNCSFSGIVDGSGRVAYGLVSSANTTLYNCQFAWCLADIYGRQTSVIRSYSHESEQCGDVYYAEDNGALGVFIGGRVLLDHKSASARWMYHNSAGAGGGLILDGLQSQWAGAVADYPTIYVRGNTSSSGGMISVTGCNIPYQSYNVVAGTGSGGIRVSIFDREYAHNMRLLSSQSLDARLVAFGSTMVPSLGNSRSSMITSISPPAWGGTMLLQDRSGYFADIYYPTIDTGRNVATNEWSVIGTGASLRVTDVQTMQAFSLDSGPNVGMRVLDSTTNGVTYQVTFGAYANEATSLTLNTAYATNITFIPDNTLSTTLKNFTMRFTATGTSGLAVYRTDGVNSTDTLSVSNCVIQPLFTADGTRSFDSTLDSGYVWNQVSVSPTLTAQISTATTRVEPTSDIVVLVPSGAEVKTVVPLLSPGFRPGQIIRMTGASADSVTLTDASVLSGSGFIAISPATNAVVTTNVVINALWNGTSWVQF